MKTKILLRSLVLIFLLYLGKNVFAQETTATLSGTVNDSKGAAISGASVVVKFESTGFQTGMQT
ncbi:MAG TPA: carboxypeptidase-like regulatory domain-containing protein, partial [Chitinophagaceae bacterium]|nr:carboxypeptidase-like regulatory domain-containing protein [Chitinophagaceae bacterium]